MPPREFYPRDDVASSPAGHMFPIVPDNAAALPQMAKSIRANTAGTVVLRTRDMAVADADIAITVAAGERIDAYVTWVKAAGTTATLHGFA